MDLKDVLYQMMQENTAAGQPTDLRVGTVTREEPLEITINPATSPLRRRQLCLTEPVIEKKIPVLAHRHRIQTLSHTHANSAGTTTTGLDGYYLGEYALVSEGADAALQGEDIVCWEDGKKLPVKDGFIILNRRLEEGDRVLLLRVQHGQKFIVLSRIFEEEA